MSVSKRRARSASGGLLASILLALPAVAAAPAARPFPNPPAWVADQTLYEVNLRQFSATGDVKGFRAQLPRLKSLGVGTLWIMPVHPIGADGRTGKLGSPYAPRDYLGFNPDFGTIDEFKAAIVEAHALGLHVILDWVPVHTSPDNPWVAQHPEWYKHDAAGALVHPMPEWRDVVALNYDVPELRKAMVEAMTYWVKDVGVDGFRCDTAEWVPLDFWCDARDALRRIKPVFLLAEGNKPELMDYAFDSVYAWNLPENTQGIVAGTKSPADLMNYLNAEAKILPAGAFRLNFTSNHDKNAWEGTTLEQLKDSVAAATVLTFTIPGMPLIYNGQETGPAEHRLNFFDRDPIVWHDDPMVELYRTLAALKRENRALWSAPTIAPIEAIAEPATPNVLAFRRRSAGDAVVVLLNLGNRPAQVKAPDGVSGMTSVVGPGATAGGDSIALPAWGYQVWSSTAIAKAK